MKASIRFIATGVSFLVLSAFAFGLPSDAHAAKKAKYKLTWVLAHEPITFFDEAIRPFINAVKAGTNGEVDVEVISATEYFGKPVPPSVAVNALKEGKFHMSQTYTTELGVWSKAMWTLDLPYLFRDHDHAKKVLDGEIGREMLAGLEEHGMKGLAFTYSGGFRILSAVKKEIRRPEDMKGLRIRTSGSPVAQRILTMLGAKPVVLTLEDGHKGLISGSLDAGETTYPRLLYLGTQNAAPMINDTGHSLFLTSIVVNKKWFESLPEKYRKVIAKAALEAAINEREFSIAEGERAKRQGKDLGLKYIELSKNEMAAFVKATAPVYDEFPQYRDLVKRIRDVQ